MREDAVVKCVYIGRRVAGTRLQCRHLIPALNAWAVRAYYTTGHQIATDFPWHGCMDDLTIERSFGS